MSTEAHRGQSSIAVDPDAKVHPVVAELLDIVKDQQEQIEELQQKDENQPADQVDHQAEVIEELRAEVAQLKEAHSQEREERARVDAEDRKRITDVEDRVEDLEEEDNTQGSTTEETDTQDDETPIERLAEEDDKDIADHASPSVERAVTLFRHIKKWGKKTPKGYVLRPEDNPLRLLESARDESLCWKQYYRTVETLEKLSKGGVTFFDSDRHGKMLCLHEHSDLFDRVETGRSPLTSSSAEKGTTVSG